MSAAASLVKKPRPLYCKSKPFEAGYAAFMADVFAKDIKTIEQVETGTDRMLVLAGVLRLRLHKKTGCLHSERLSADAGIEASTWVRAHPIITSFWANNAEVSGVLAYAWSQRLARFVPPAEVCYPGALPRQRAYHLAKDDRWSMALHNAAARRLGGGRRKLTLIKRFVSLLWNFLVSRDDLRLCHAYFGRKATLDAYNVTVRRRTDLAARLQETPNLAPIIGSYLLSSPEFQKGKQRIPQDILLRAKASLFDAAVTGEALTPAGWRNLAGQSAAAVARLLGVALREGSEPGKELVPVLNLLGKTGERPPLTLAVRLLEHLRNLRYNFDPQAYSEVQDTLVRFVRLASQQAMLEKKKGRLKRFVSGDFLLAWDWLKHREGENHYRRGPQRTLAAIPKNATWASIMRAQQAWHADQAERERRQREADESAYRAWQRTRDALRWESLLPACEIFGATVLPLTTGKGLREEGERMHHCVGGYIDACLEGGSRIFSVKLVEEEATLELVKRGKHQWKIQQIFGPRNTPVSKSMQSVAKAVAVQYATLSAEAVEMSVVCNP